MLLDRRADKQHARLDHPTNQRDSQAAAAVPHSAAPSNSANRYGCTAPSICVPVSLIDSSM
jgi:hypothetical protein